MCYEIKMSELNVKVDFSDVKIITALVSNIITSPGLGRSE